MLLDGPRQDDLFEIFPFVDQIGDRILVRDANDLLFDDRAGVQFGSDIVAGRPDDLYAAFESRYGFAPINAGRNEWWILMIRFGKASIIRSEMICM